MVVIVRQRLSLSCRHVVLAELLWLLEIGRVGGSDNDGVVVVVVIMVVADVFRVAILVEW